MHPLCHLLLCHPLPIPCDLWSVYFSEANNFSFPHMSENVQYLSFCGQLISLTIMSSRIICVVQMEDSISF